MAYRPDDVDRVDPLRESDLEAEPLAPEGVIAASNGEVSGTSSLQDATVTAESTADLQTRTEDTGPPLSSDTDEEIEAARAEIEQTRAEMSETIDAIQEKLSPDTLKEQAKEAVREATIGKVEQTVTTASDRVAETVGTASDQAAQTVSTASDRVAETVSTASNRAAQTVSTASGMVSGAGSSAVQNLRQNVIPLLVVGLGVAGLAIGGRRARDRRRKKATMSPYGRAGQVVSQAQQRAGQVAGQARGKAGQLRERAGRAGGKAQEATDRGGSFQARLAQIKGTTARVAQRGQEQTQTQPAERRSPWGGTGLLEDTPVAVIDLIAALAVAIALAVLRRARRENWF